MVQQIRSRLPPSGRNLRLRLEILAQRDGMAQSRQAVGAAPRGFGQPTLLAHRDAGGGVPGGIKGFPKPRRSCQTVSTSRPEPT